MERYAALAGRGRGRLVVVLNKVDLAPDELLAERFAELDRLGVPEEDRYLASARSGGSFCWARSRPAWISSAIASAIAW